MGKTSRTAAAIRRLSPQDTLRDEFLYYVHAKLRDDLKKGDIVPLLLGHAAIASYFRQKGANNLDG